VSRVVVDPVTRIEGHLRLEVEVSGGEVADAWSSGTMFRGLETIMKDRDPRDAWKLAQRVCGVCTSVHATMSCRAVEDALGIEIPNLGRLIRNLIQGAVFVHDHVIHFYHLHMLDWVDVVSALDADADATSDLQKSLSNWKNKSPEYFQGVQDKLQGLVDSGQLGHLTSGYWGHSAYQLPPEGNLMMMAHYLEALDFQRNVIKIHAILGGKNPHPQTFVVGGMNTRIDPDGNVGSNEDGIAQLKDLAKLATDFLDEVVVPDALYLGRSYPQWLEIGRSYSNYLAYGDFPEDNDGFESNYLPRGRIVDGDLSTAQPVDVSKIAETVKHSWFKYEGSDSELLPPSAGETDVNYTGPTPPYDHILTEKYSWMKSPRYDGVPYEVGPLARMMVAYAAGNTEARRILDDSAENMGIGVEDFNSALGRTIARQLETAVLAHRLRPWIDDLQDAIRSGDRETANTSKWKKDTWDDKMTGAGIGEAPRGAVGHWTWIEREKIKGYQMIVPSTWNGSPRDHNDKRGAWEESLLGLPLADASQPLELLRTIHSYDPCMSCAVHVFDPEGGETLAITIV